MNSPAATKLVNEALDKRKIRPDQRQWAMDYATRDPKRFEVFVNKAHPIPEIPSSLPAKAASDETQRQINKMCGVDDETFQKYGPDAKKPDEDPLDEVQRLINKLLGVDDETYRKYSPK